MYCYGLVDYFSHCEEVRPKICDLFKFYFTFLLDLSYELQNLPIMFTTGLYVNIAINMNINHFE